MRYIVRNRYKKSVDEYQVFECDDYPFLTVSVVTNYRWGYWTVEDPVLDNYDEEDSGPWSIFDLECMFERDLEFDELDDACSEDYEIEWVDGEHNEKYLEFQANFEEMVEEEGLFDALDNYGFYETSYEHSITSPIVLEKRPLRKET